MTTDAALGESSIDFDFIEYLRQFVTENKQQIFEKALALRTRRLTVVLEDLYQSHNASACLRSCDCFGVQDVHIIENEHEFRVSRMISVGAAQWLTMHHYKAPEHNTLSCIARLRARGYRIVATASRDDAAPLEEFDVSRPTALLFGTEKKGLSPEALDNADEVLCVPTYGFTESLNVSVACALCLHHLTWKLRRSGAEIGLSEAEKKILRAEWIKTAIGARLPAYERFYYGRPRSRKRG